MVPIKLYSLKCKKYVGKCYEDHTPTTEFDNYVSSVGSASGLGSAGRGFEPESLG